MKLSRRLLLGSLILSLAVVLLAGCGIPQADYDELDAEYTTLQAEHEALQNELAEIKEVYPPKEFSSLSELDDWLLENDVSDRVRDPRSVKHMPHNEESRHIGHDRASETRKCFTRCQNATQHQREQNEQRDDIESHSVAGHQRGNDANQCKDK